MSVNRRGRPEAPIRSGPGPLRDFTQALRALRVAAGTRTYREMAEAGHVSVSALTRAASGEAFPSLAVTLAFVRACHGDLDEWRARWQETHARLDAERERTHLGAGPDTTGAALTSVPAHWSVPWPRNPHFVGRRLELATLRARLTGDQQAGLPQVLLGPPGVGKTQLTVEYAYRRAVDYDIVWWIDAEQPATMLAALSDLASRLGIAVRGDVQASTRALTEHLTAPGPHRRWLLVLDNAGAPAPHFGLLSAAALAPGGHLLITSRDPGWSAFAGQLELDGLPSSDAVRLLVSRVPWLTDADADRVAHALGFLPLALEQAGSWLAETATPVDTYLEHLAVRIRDVMSRNTPHAHASVAATFSEALDNLGDPAAASLALLWAHFGPEPVPLGLFHPGAATVLPEPLRTAAKDPMQFRDLVRVLVHTGLVRPVGDNRVAMHRLARLFLQESAPPALRHELSTSVHGLLTAAWSGNQAALSTWHGYAEIYPHVVESRLVQNTAPECRALILWLIWALRAAGDYPSSRQLAEQAYQHWSTSIGSHQLDTMLAAVNLAATRWAQGEPEAAQRVIAHAWRRHRAPATASSDGSAFPDCPDDIENTLLPRVRRTYGADHPHAITVTAHVAASNWALGDFAAAERLFQEVCARAGRVLGADHPHTIRASAFLGSALHEQGERGSARTLLRATLVRAREFLGDSHPDTIRTAANLLTVLRADDADGFPGAVALAPDADADTGAGADAGADAGAVPLSLCVDILARAAQAARSGADRPGD